MFGKAGQQALRFKVGTEVLCRTGAEEWSAGKIVQLNYREPDWPRGRTVPYQVELEDGALIFVPNDVEQLCRKLELPWWGSLFKGKGPSPQQLRQACVGKDVNEQDHTGNTALMGAMRPNWQPVVLELISMSADVNISNKKKQRPLHLAVPLGASMTQALLQAKADPNVQDTDPDYDPEFTSTTFGDRLEHRTPLHHCCAASGDAAVAALLIEAGAKLDIQDAQYKTPLHLAIEEGRTNIIDTLLRAKADVNLANLESGMKNTPLMDAAHAGKCELAEKLIAAKADINAQGKSDMSALHLAARRGDINVVRLLVAARADVAQKSQCGTAADLAKKKTGSISLLELLGVKIDGPGGTLAEKTPTCIASLGVAQRAALFLE
mmetsp:Transcript_35055/g.109112  ORF Transcript_35055/g.109112 Transcript_35055/m.109112 type:complete len:379 (+) Transcript_35055:126-1262(+)